MTYQIKALGLVNIDLGTENFFRNIRAQKGPREVGLEMISEKLLLHPHGSLCAGYAKSYFAHLLYLLLVSLKLSNLSNIICVQNDCGSYLYLHIIDIMNSKFSCDKN